MYRALRQEGVPVELVTYPREDHGPLARWHLRLSSPEPWHGFDARQRIVEFLDKALQPRRFEARGSQAVAQGRHKGRKYRCARLPSLCESRFARCQFCCSSSAFDLPLLRPANRRLRISKSAAPPPQLIVDGKPFLILGGELHNSSSSSLDYMKPIWLKLAGMGLNTVVTPLSWELIEPNEGAFDFTLVDGLLAQAREEHERVVFLWLASWKNGMSSYAPV